jgi:mono/diheme cytochrome c family protein
MGIWRLFFSMTLMVCAISAHAAADGEQLFKSICALCHGPQAQGTPGLAPPIKTEQWSRFADARHYVPSVMLAGMNGQLITDAGPFVGVMPPQNRLTDEEIAAVANYLLMSINGHPDWKPLTSEEVAVLRANTPTVANLRALRKQALGK